jgi:hypothetical protein
MNLPEPCERCMPFGGSWAQAENGMVRCDCARGVALAAAGSKKPAAAGDVEPVVSAQKVTICVEMLAAIPFFPGESGARLIIGDELRLMCTSDEQALWLAQRMVRLYDRWPGAKEMRRVFCASHQPLDGVQEIGASEVFPEGIPSERPKEPEQKLLPPRSKHVSAAKSVDDAVQDLAFAKNLDRISHPRIRDIPLKQLKPEDRITADQVQEAERLYREEKAREEL